MSLRSYCATDPAHVLAQRSSDLVPGRCTLAVGSDGGAVVEAVVRVPRGRGGERWAAELLAAAVETDEMRDEERGPGASLLRVRFSGLCIVPHVEGVPLWHVAEPGAVVLVPERDTRGERVWRVCDGGRAPLLSIHGADPLEMWPSLALSARDPLAA